MVGERSARVSQGIVAVKFGRKARMERAEVRMLGRVA